MQGSITTEYTVWCAKCEVWYQECWSSNKSKAIEAIKVRGWKLAKGKWLCPAHSGIEVSADPRMISVSDLKKIMK